MTVRVDELTSDVTVEPGANKAAGSGSPPTAPPEHADDMRALMDRLSRDAERTRAEAYGD
jgi:hypothetical protein